METYKITLTGQSPLLMHKDNINWAEEGRLPREGDPVCFHGRLLADGV